jgi:hypothetical protein
MSCRFERVVDGDDLVVLCVSGKLTGEHVDTLRSLLSQAVGALAIDLNSVSLVDREGVQFLALTEYNGTELRNCPAYVREWVTREKAEIRAELPDLPKAQGSIDDI